jgi:Cu/Ag efflux pump CusA
MIHWPAAIKYDGDDELSFIGSEQEWTRDAGSLLYNHKGDDYLIDSSGHIFSIDHVHDEVITTADTGRRILLQDFIRLVRIHASNSHRCCIEKINFRNIAEGISLLANMNNND